MDAQLGLFHSRLSPNSAWVLPTPSGQLLPVMPPMVQPTPSGQLAMLWDPLKWGDDLEWLLVEQ